MKTVTVVTYLSEDDAREILRIAERMGLSVAAVVRMCVRYVLHEAVVATPLQTIARKTGEKEGEGNATGEGN
jgi:antitoxin component of RelBE/YafQ-DinJ toxin-antitoxin module